MVSVANPSLQQQKEPSPHQCTTPHETDLLLLLLLLLLFYYYYFYAPALVLEYFAPTLVHYFPIYYVAKLIFLVWCFLPQTQVSSMPFFPAGSNLCASSFFAMLLAKKASAILPSYGNTTTTTTCAIFFSLSLSLHSFQLTLLTPGRPQGAQLVYTTVLSKFVAASGGSNETLADKAGHAVDSVRDKVRNTVQEGEAAFKRLSQDLSELDKKHN